MDLIKAFTNEQLKAEVPSFSIGDTVRVENKIKEGNRERIQIYGCGVEKTFPLHSPNVAGITVIRVGKVRRAKLYYLRDRVGKASKVKEQID